MKRFILPLILILCLVFTLTGFCWVAGYDQRIKLTIDHTKIDADVTWFPVTISLTSGQGEEVFAEFDADEDFDRIAFTTSDEETQLYADCELFDDSESVAIYHVSKTGWVLDNDVDTDFYMYYDNNAAHNTIYIRPTKSKWQDYESNPVYAHNGHAVVMEPSIVYEDSGFTLWFTDYVTDSYSSLFRARSNNGIDFTDTPEALVLDDVGRISIKKIGSTYYAFGRKVVDGDYTTDLNIYGWSSADGISWSPMNSGDIIIAQGGEEDWDYRLENTTFTLDGSTWKILYEASTLDYGCSQIGYAEGSTFPLTKDGSNPIIPHTGHDWCNIAIGAPELLELSDGTKLLFVLGQSLISPYKYDLGILYSTSLNSGWQDLPNNPILHVSGIYLSDPAVCYFDGYLWLYYNYNQEDLHLMKFNGIGIALPSEYEVYDDNFKAVYHMHDNTTSTILDSTSNNNHGAKKGANEPIEATGKVGLGQNYDGANDFINLIANGGMTQNLSYVTISNIIKLDAMPSVVEHIFLETQANQAYVKFWMAIYANGSAEIRWRDSATGSSLALTTDASLITTATWYHIACILDTVNDEQYIYIDGAQVASGTTATGVVYNDTPGFSQLGAGQPTNWTNDFVDGIIDESYISNSARTAAWVKATYYSLWDTLLTYGSEETSAVEENAIFFGMNF